MYLVRTNLVIHRQLILYLWSIMFLVSMIDVFTINFRGILTYDYSVRKIKVQTLQIHSTFWGVYNVT